jgi:phosphatidate cytidylyltransferase
VPEAATVPPPPAAPSKGRVFLRRLFSSVVLWTVVLLALFNGDQLVSDIVFVGVMTTLAIAGLWEFYALVTRCGLPCYRNWGLAGGATLIILTYLHFANLLGITGSPARVNDFEITLLILFVLGLCLRQFFSRDNSRAIPAIATTLLGLMYVPWLLNFIQKINFFSFPAAGSGTFYVLYFIVVTKFSDIGAYGIGSLLGRHKMIPRISPGKTWEGFAGAVAVSTAASLGFAHFGAGKLHGMTPLHAAVLGVLLSVSAVVGDLIESIFKREAGVKDSGGFFPGIGGILDLLDSLLFNAPLMYLYLRHVLTD